MAKYRKVDTRIWLDANFLSMSDDAQLAFLYVLTHPDQSSCGAFRDTVEGLAGGKRWAVERMAAALREPGDRVVIRDGIVWLPNFLRYNAPENPNVCVAMARGVEDLPESETRDAVTRHVMSFLDSIHQSLGKGFRNGLTKEYLNRMSNPGAVSRKPLAVSRSSSPSVVGVSVVNDITLERASTVRANGRAAARGRPEVQAMCDDWREIVGGSPAGGEIAGAFTRIEKEGVPWTAIRPVWRWSLQWHVTQGRMEFFKPGDFASRFRYFATKAVRGSGRGGLTDMDDAARFLRGAK